MVQLFLKLFNITVAVTDGDVFTVEGEWVSTPKQKKKKIKFMSISVIWRTMFDSKNVSTSMGKVFVISSVGESAPACQ